MSVFRRAISVGAIGSAATLGLLVIASAPAASSQAARPNLFLAHPARHVDIAERPKLSGWQGRRAGGLAGEVRLVVESSRPHASAALAARLGGRVERTEGELVQVSVPRSAVASLESSPASQRVRAPYAKVEHGVSGEGVAATLAAAWHEKGLTGKGVKVAVIDGGFAGLADRQAAGELPTNAIKQDFCDGDFDVASDHGTAVAEIVHEMAPDAQLYLLCIGTEVDLAAAVRYAKSQGVHIVNHSIGWAGPTRGDGSGPIGAIVEDARAGGILWVNSAGNEAETHWSGTYNPSGRLHAWDASGDLGNSFVWPNESEICGFLKWDEWPAGISDFDLGLFVSGTNEFVDSSEEEQGSGEPPYEALCLYQESGRDLVVFWAIRGWSVTTSPRLDLFSWSPPLEYATPAGSIADPATSRASLAVGAVCWQSGTLEPFSSQGPTIDGRTKPDIVGHDSVSSATYGSFGGCRSGFAGTSASSPEVAGAAALVRQAYPRHGPAELQQYLVRSVVDYGTVGIDNESGAGVLRLPKPPDAKAPTAIALPGSGRAGRTVRLVATVQDDSGEVRLVGQVKRNGRVVATVERGFVRVAGEAKVALTWKAPKTARGSYRHCIRASDRGGNTSPPSCARLVLR